MSLLAVACTADEASDGDAEANPAVPSRTVAIPAERLSPFCQAMIDLSERLETDPPDDVASLIIDTYLEIADDVPAEIANEFAAVLARLQDGSATEPGLSTPPVSTAPPPREPVTVGSSTPGEGDRFFEEGYLPGDDPAERLNAYVAFACRDNENNPGPPATQPLDDIVPPTTE